MSLYSVGFCILVQSIEHWQLWNNLPTATSSVLLHEFHRGCHLQHVNHPPVATQSETSRSYLSPCAMKARTLASGAPSETTHSLQFPTHTFNLLALMQMLLRAENTAVLSLCELTSLFKQNRNFISLSLCSYFPVNSDGTKKKVATLLFTASTQQVKRPVCCWRNGALKNINCLNSLSFQRIMQSTFTVDLRSWPFCLYTLAYIECN